MAGTLLFRAAARVDVVPGRSLALTLSSARAEKPNSLISAAPLETHAPWSEALDRRHKPRPGRHRPPSWNLPVARSGFKRLVLRLGLTFVLGRG